MKFLSFFLFILIIFIPFVSAQSIGISPGKLINNNLLEGSTFEQSIVLSKDQNSEINVETTVEGDITDWIEVPKEIKLERGSKNTPSLVKINVPEEVALGNYSANVNYLVKGIGNVHMAFSLPIELTVTNETTSDYRIKHLKVNQSGKETQVSFEVFNDGNTRSGPTQISINIVEILTEKSLFSGSKTIEKTEPFEFIENFISFDSNLDKGNYWVFVNISSQLQNYEEEVFLENIVFENLEIDEIENQNETLYDDPINKIDVGQVQPEETIELNNYEKSIKRDQFWIAFFLILSLIIAMFIIMLFVEGNRSKKKKKKRKNGKMRSKKRSS